MAAAIDTFAMLNVLGFAAAVLVIGVVIVYLQARQRSRAVAYVLSQRMGMGKRQGRSQTCWSSVPCSSRPSS